MSAPQATEQAARTRGMVSPAEGGTVPPGQTPLGAGLAYRSAQENMAEQSAMGPAIVTGSQKQGPPIPANYQAPGEPSYGRPSPMGGGQTLGFAGVEAGAASAYQSLQTGFEDLFVLGAQGGKGVGEVLQGKPLQYIGPSNYATQLGGQSQYLNPQQEARLQMVTSEAAYLFPGAAALKGVGESNAPVAQRAFDIGVGALPFVPFGEIGEAGGVVGRYAISIPGRAAVGAGIGAAGGAAYGESPTGIAESAAIGAAAFAGPGLIGRGIGAGSEFLTGQAEAGRAAQALSEAPLEPEGGGPSIGQRIAMGLTGGGPLKAAPLGGVETAAPTSIGEGPTIRSGQFSDFPEYGTTFKTQEINVGRGGEVVSPPQDIFASGTAYGGRSTALGVSGIDIQDVERSFPTKPGLFETDATPPPPVRSTPAPPPLEQPGDIRPASVPGSPFEYSPETVRTQEFFRGGPGGGTRDFTGSGGGPQTLQRTDVGYEIARYPGMDFDVTARAQMFQTPSIEGGDLQRPIAVSPLQTAFPGVSEKLVPRVNPRQSPSESLVPSFVPAQTPELVSLTTPTTVPVSTPMSTYVTIPTTVPVTTPLTTPETTPVPSVPPQSIPTFSLVSPNNPQGFGGLAFAQPFGEPQNYTTSRAVFGFRTKKKPVAENILNPTGSDIPEGFKTTKRRKKK